MSEKAHDDKNSYTPGKPALPGTGVPGLKPKLDPKGESNNATLRKKPSTSISANNIKEIQSPETVNILVNQHYGTKPHTIETGVTVEEAEEIRELIINLEEAITNNDKEAVSYYGNLLNNKGIFGDKYQEFYTNEEYNQKLNLKKRANLFDKLTSKADDNFSNTFCFFNAIGKGLLVSNLGLRMWEAMVRIISNASGFIEAFILFIIFAPLVLTVIVLTGFIPFRIMMPQGAVVMEEGKITSLGLQGLKRETVTEQVIVNMSFFTGLSISIPGNSDTGRDPFCWISGFAIQVYESDL